MTEPSGDPPPASPADEVLADAARIGPFFAVRVVPAADLPADLTVAERVNATATALGIQDRRVAGSLYFQGLAARLWSPSLAVAFGAGAVLSLDPAGTVDRQGLWTVAPTITKPAAGPIERLYPEVVERHLEPLADAIGAEAVVSPQVLWGNAASALVGSARVLADHMPVGFDEVLALLNRGRLRGTGDVDGDRDPTGDHPNPSGREIAAGFRRRSCCLYYRVPGGGFCGDCVISATS